MTDRSVSGLTQNVSVEAAPENRQRRYLLINVQTSADVWLNFGAPAVRGPPSIRIQGNSNFIMNNYVAWQSVWLLKDGSGSVDVTVKEA